MTGHSFSPRPAIAGWTIVAYGLASSLGEIACGTTGERLGPSESIVRTDGGLPEAASPDVSAPAPPPLPAASDATVPEAQAPAADVVIPPKRPCSPDAGLSRPPD